MHTTRAGVRDDIAGNYGSYDWKNAVSLRTRSGGDNWNNADNLAYFALGKNILTYITKRTKAKRKLLHSPEDERSQTSCSGRR